MPQQTSFVSDPFAVLGVDRQAGDEQIRLAYLAKLKQYPPDRAPEEFQRVREAYELLRDRRSRAHYKLFSVDPEVPLNNLLGDNALTPKFLGPGPWLAALKER